MNKCIHHCWRYNTKNTIQFLQTILLNKRYLYAHIYKIKENPFQSLVLCDATATQIITPQIENHVRKDGNDN